MDFAPYEFDENGKARGFNIDLWEQIGNNLNKTINFVPMHWDNVMNSLQNGSVDAINAFDTEVREDIMDFSNEILDCKYRIFVRDDVSGITSISDLASHTVAIVVEDASIDHLVKEVPGSYIIKVKNLEDGILKLKNEEVFSFITSHYSGIYYIHKNHINNIKIIGDEIDLGNYSIAVKKGNTELLGKINNSLQIVIASDFYKNNMDKWFGEDMLNGGLSSSQFLTFILILSGLAVVSAILVFWNRTLSRLNKKLENAMAHVKKLSGYLPICASCKRVRNKQGEWIQIEEYIHNHSEAEFSHGLCQECMEKLYPELIDQ